MTLGLIDIAVLISSFALAIWIGIRSAKGTITADDYMFGGRSLPWWAILGSIVATETSTATVLSIPGFGFGEVGLKFLQIPLGYMLGRTAVVLILLPLFFRGTLSSAYQVLGQRFGRRATLAGSLLFLVTRNLGDGLRLFLAAMVLHKLGHWDFNLCAIATGVVTIAYTYLGGMRSVVWNDCIQLVIYIAGAIVSVIYIANQIDGGWTELLRYAQESGKFSMFAWGPPTSISPMATTDLSPSSSSLLHWVLTNPYSFWAGVMGGAFLTLGTHGTDQMMIQRYLSARSQRDAGKAILASSLVVFFQFALFLFIGIQLACFYSQAEPTVTFAKADEVYAHFLVNSFPPNTGMIGLILAAILAAAMSTLSSSLNSSATAVINDFYLTSNPQPPPPQSKLLMMTQLLTIAFGVLQVVVGILATHLSEQVVSSALTIAGYSAGLLLGLFSLGILTKRVGQNAALAGAAVGLAALLFVQFVLPLDGFGGFKLAWPWYSLVGCAVTFLVGLGLSLMLPEKTDPTTSAVPSSSR